MVLWVDGVSGRTFLPVTLILIILRYPFIEGKLWVGGDLALLGFPIDVSLKKR